MKDLPSRILGSIFVVLPTLFFLYLGPLYFFFYLFILNIGAVLEWSLNLEKNTPLLPFLLVGSVSVFLGSFLLGLKGALVGVTIFLLFTLLYFLFSEAEVFKVSLSFLVISYISLAFSYLLFIREMKGGLLLSLFFFFVIWIFDVFSYFGGNFFGRYLLAPSISPKKTWEGFFSGVLGGLLVGLFFYFLGFFPLFFSLTSSFLLTLFSLLGDLIESKIKRYFKIKDSGKIYLGHGGILDRFDAVLFSSIAFYYLLRCF